MTALDLAAIRAVDLPDWTVTPRRRLRSRLISRLFAVREIGILTVVALAGYILAAFWMRDVQHFYINDALNRTADALYVTLGRDPHLGAIGFFWPPLPQLLNMIFVPIVEPFGLTIMAGPLETACCMALTIPVLAKLGVSLGVGRRTTFVVCLVFALTPVAIYNSTNGMSEAAFFLTGAASMLGFLRYIRSRSTGDLIFFSVALAGLSLTRLEGPFITVVLAFVATFEWSNLRSRSSMRQSAWTYLLIVLPAAACFGFWLLVQWILLKSPLFFLHQAGSAPPVNAPWLPKASSEPGAAFPWAGHWIVVLGLTLVIAALGVVIRPRSDRTRGSIGIVSAMVVIAAIQIDSTGFRDGYGDPRYFSMAVPFGFAAALWLAARTRRAWTPWWNVGLIAVLVLNAGTGNWTMSSGTTTGIEHECVFFQRGVAHLLPFLGRGGTPGTGSFCTPFIDEMKPFEQIGATLDRRITPRDRVLTDNSSMFAADLFTMHPSQFIVRNDRDWQKITANPVEVTYIITESSTRTGRPEQGTALATQGYTDYGAQIINGQPAAWRLVASSNGGLTVVGTSAWVQLYQRVGAVAPAGINAPR